MAHTPGPWEAGTAGFTFSNLKSWRVVPVGSRQDQISQDDLDLIAAAPDLLEACKAARSIISDTRFTYIYDQIDAAIAKAEPKA